MGKGRHHVEAESRGPAGLIVGGIVLVAVVVAGYLFVGMARGTPSCSTTTAFSLSVSPDLAPTVSELVADAGPGALGCRDVSVTAQDPVATAQGMIGGIEAPDLWIPDSMKWVRQVNKSVSDPVELAAQSVAVSPAVILAGGDGLQAPDSWIDVMRRTDIRLGNPVASATATAPVLAAVAEAESLNVDEEAIAESLVPAAQAQSKQLSADALKSADSAPKVADSVRERGGMGVVTEQAAVALGPEFTAVVPATGSVFMDYPLVVAAPLDRRADAAEAGRAVSELLESEAGRAGLSAAGFRAESAAALDGGRGVGVIDELVAGNAAAAERALGRWSALAVPTRGLVVIDVSGSMAAPAGEGATRIGLTQQAALVGAELFPGNAQLGLWAFSLDLDGPQKDYLELAPITMLDTPSGAGTHRNDLATAVGSLSDRVAGGTGLYDTVFAAYQKVLEDYDPNAVNAVILLTDGENEDPVSITLDQLLDGLDKLSDPARPVIVVAIGITDDADEDVLAQIAKATGGSSYVARDPADIPTVFVKALGQRQG